MFFSDRVNDQEKNGLIKLLPFSSWFPFSLIVFFFVKESNVSLLSETQFVWWILAESHMMTPQGVLASYLHGGTHPLRRGRSGYWCGLLNSGGDVARAVLSADNQ